MAKEWKVKLDRAGVGAILKGSDARKMVDSVADTINTAAAANIPAQFQGARTRVDKYTTDRGAAAVVLEARRGVSIEAKYAPLRNGARAAGVKVTGG